MLSERVRELLAHKKLTRDGLASSINMDFTRLQNVLSGRVKKLKPEEIFAIRNKHGVNPEWLESGKGKRDIAGWQGSLQAGLAVIASTSREARGLGLDANRETALELLLFAVKTGDKAGFEEARQQLSSDGDMVYVPRHDVKASAGNGAMVHDESIVDHLAFKREWITKTMGCSPDAVCVIQVRGDSMSPTFNDADLLLLDMRHTDKKSEGVYVIQLAGALLVKRLRFKLKGGMVEVVSDNHMNYPMETLSNDELNELVIVGRVVWHGAKF
jgi:phage repressor protein C with HTH and peptisase S24 domain